jgi:hypothetical protein
VADNTGATGTTTTLATISAIATPTPSVIVSSQTLQDIQTGYGIILSQQFYASDTNGDGIVDVFTDPNNILTPVGFANISGHAAFLLSTNNDTIPEFFWDCISNTITNVTYTPTPLTTPFIDAAAKTVIIKITVNKARWIYIDITDQYPPEKYPAYTFTVKAGDRVISPDRIWRKDGKVYIFDDPATNYDLIYGFTILPPMFYPVNGTTVTTPRPTFTITYPQQVSIIVALLDSQNIMSQLTTTDNRIFIFTPTTDFTEGTHTLSLTAQDDQANTLTSSSTVLVSLPKKSGNSSYLWIIIIIIAIILVIIALLLYLRRQGYL